MEREGQWEVAKLEESLKTMSDKSGEKLGKKQVRDLLDEFTYSKVRVSQRTTQKECRSK